MKRCNILLIIFFLFIIIHEAIRKNIYLPKLFYAYLIILLDLLEIFVFYRFYKMKSLLILNILWVSTNRYAFHVIKSIKMTPFLF